MSNVEKFDIKEFRKRAGLSNDTYHYHKTKGHIPPKTVFTESDVMEFLTKYTQRKGAVIAANKGGYTIEEFSKQIGVSYKNFFNLRNAGKVPKKDSYTKEDVENFKKGAPLKDAKKDSNNTEDKYSTKDFAPLINSTQKNGYNLKSKGVIPKKLKFSDQDVANYLQYKNRNKKNTITTPSDGKYTLDQFAKELGDITKSGLISAIRRGNILKKDFYTLKDIEKFKKTRKGVGGSPRKQNFDIGIKSVISTKPFKTVKKENLAAIADAEENNPFEIRTGVVTGIGASPFIPFLVDKMSKLQIYKAGSNEYVHIPANTFGDPVKAGTAMASAKKIIAQEFKELAKASFRLINRKNSANIYTHSQIIRIA